MGRQAALNQEVGAVLQHRPQLQCGQLLLNGLCSCSKLQALLASHLRPTVAGGSALSEDAVVHAVLECDAGSDVVAKGLALSHRLACGV